MRKIVFMVAMILPVISIMFATRRVALRKKDDRLWLFVLAAFSLTSIVFIVAVNLSFGLSLDEIASLDSRLVPGSHSTLGFGVGLFIGVLLLFLKSNRKHGE
jgi:hypothetical protein